MGKFKVGDIVRIVKPHLKFKNEFNGEIREIIEYNSITDSFVLKNIKMWRWFDDELELVKLKTAELKIDSFNKKIEIKKEGNEMIESMNLIDLYASKHKENIEKEAKEKIEELRKKCDVINKYNELVEQFKKDCDELYLSQFTEEEKEEALSEAKEVNDINKQLQRKFGTLYRYEPNKEFTTEEMTEIMENMAQKKCEINDLVKTVKAHVGIAKTKEEVEEILTRYEIIDKKGKLVIK